jgi:hypothetical protein
MIRLLLTAVSLIAVSASADPLADAHADYLLYCRGCHLHTGDAVPAANVPSLQALAPLVKTPAGREYIVRVPGVSQTPMDDERLAAVLNWVLESFNGDTLPDDFEPYTAEEVAEARVKVLKDPLKTRAEILEGS